MSFKDGDLHIEVKRLRAENHELRELVRYIIALHQMHPYKGKEIEAYFALREDVNRRIMEVGL